MVFAFFREKHCVLFSVLRINSARMTMVRETVSILCLKNSVDEQIVPFKETFSRIDKAVGYLGNKPHKGFQNMVTVWHSGPFSIIS